MAKNSLLINVDIGETRVGLIEAGILGELYVERKRDRSPVGNIYLGKVARVLPGMQSAFIDVGLERAAFLHVADLHGGPHHGHPAARGDVVVQVPIERQVFEGQTLRCLAFVSSCTVCGHTWDDESHAAANHLEMTRACSVARVR